MRAEKLRTIRQADRGAAENEWILVTDRVSVKDAEGMRTHLSHKSRKDGPAGVAGRLNPCLRQAGPCGIKDSPRQNRLMDGESGASVHWFTLLCAPLRK